MIPAKVKDTCSNGREPRMRGDDPVGNLSYLISDA